MSAVKSKSLGGGGFLPPAPCADPVPDEETEKLDAEMSGQRGVDASENRETEAGERSATDNRVDAEDSRSGREISYYWTCDYCIKASFDTQREAIDHEAICSFNPSVHTPHRTEATAEQMSVDKTEVRTAPPSILRNRPSEGANNEGNTSPQSKRRSTKTRMVVLLRKFVTPLKIRQRRNMKTSHKNSQQSKTSTSSTNFNSTSGAQTSDDATAETSQSGLGPRSLASSESDSTHSFQSDTSSPDVPRHSGEEEDQNPLLRCSNKSNALAANGAIVARKECDDSPLQKFTQNQGGSTPESTPTQRRSNGKSRARRRSRSPFRLTSSRGRRSATPEGLRGRCTSDEILKQIGFNSGRTLGSLRKALGRKYENRLSL